MHNPCRPHRPCGAPPHPDALARLGPALFQQGASTGPMSAAAIDLLGAPTGSVPGINEGIIIPQSFIESFGAPAGVSSGAAADRAPLRGAIRAIVVLVEFSDTKIVTGAKERFQDLFFSTGKIATGSVTEYYQDVSNGKISLTGDVVGPFLMPLTSVQYANGAYGRGAVPNSQTLAADALAAVKDKVNFNPYDNDGNGFVDAFIVVHAGTGAEQSSNLNNIWSVQWNIPQVTKVNDVNISAFLTIPDDATLGICAHELGHLLFGWPDLYDTDLSSQGVGDWCLMSYGSWGGFPAGVRPVHPSAWCKAQQGWVDVVTETQNHQITCQDVKSGRQIHRLWKNGDASSQEYFLIENRELVGYDASLHGGGLLVWHIDDSQPNNRDETHPKVGLVQADGLGQLNKANTGRGDAGDQFPGTANNRTITSTSNPNTKSFAGDDTFVSITAISDPGPTMTMTITVTPIAAGDFSPTTWYRLRNTFAGHALDVINDGKGSKDGLIQMAPQGNFSGQFWQLKQRGDGTYAIRNLFLGPTKQLDVYGDDKKKPHLADAGNFSGQFWTIKPWGDGSYFFSNAYSGSDLVLDTMEGGPRVAMNDKNTGRPTERWTATAIGPITQPGFNN